MRFVAIGLVLIAACTTKSDWVRRASIAYEQAELKELEAYNAYMKGVRLSRQDVLTREIYEDAYKNAKTTIRDARQAFIEARKAGPKDKAKFHSLRSEFYLTKADSLVKLMEYLNQQLENE